MKDDESFAIQWQNHNARVLNYNTYNSDGVAVAKKVVLSGGFGSKTYDAFRSVSDR